jgi:hypothetical protein
MTVQCFICLHLKYDCALFFFFCIGSVATGELNFTSTEHLEPAPFVPLAPAAAPLAPAALFDRSDRSASDFATNPFASFDGLDVSSARNEAQSAPSNQDFVQGASGGKK